ncbi:MAG: ribosome biogenesis GTPase Der [Alphaproteobacteria bacterium]|nr:ribosome biogenesis GTPase Der [Alphaproteobacteria bacterium]
MPLTLAIVGRPNVGKSRLFNRLAGRAAAIVHDTPGVTRDRQALDADFAGLSLTLIDTAGFEEAESGSLAQRMTSQTVAAIAEAGALLFVIDARAGVTTGDEIIAQALHKSGKPVILLANKCEGRTQPLDDVYALGFGEPIRISAEHNLGMDEVADALAPLAPASQAEPAEDEDQGFEEADGDESPEEGALDEGTPEEGAEVRYLDRPLRLALVGRPNVGKSSLFNQLLGEERSLTGPEAGLTRDAVTAPWMVGDRQVLLHDTAGLRKKARVAGETLEEMSVASTLEAIRFADCVIVMIDATQPFEKQDLTIADRIAREGRAIVFAVNKWDLLENKAGAISRMREKLDRLLPQVAGAPLVATSARTGEGLDRLVPAIMEADRAWNTRVGTATLNRFLEAALTRHAPPAISGRRVRIRYMTQRKARPPSFTLFGNQLDGLPEDYLRYLQNGLRENFDLKGTPLRFNLRNSKNPYDPKR